MAHHGRPFALAADVSVDYDHHADFSQIHTYSWIGVRAGDSLWQERITRAVDNELQAKGWQKVDSGGDAGVSAFGRTAERDNPETFYEGFPGWRWRGWGGMATTTVVPERVGNLTVDVFLGNTKELIWRASASDVLSSKPEKNDKKMDEAVNKMFKHFPPARINGAPPDFVRRRYLRSPLPPGRPAAWRACCRAFLYR